ncbi:MAG TPA: response regulator [Nitrospira sp.]|nr:response regulator [Nitrospira sp.]
MASPQHSTPSRSPTLLMVEDDEITATMLKVLLERRGYRIAHVPDGQQALAHIDRTAPPSLVLLDVMLPYYSGLQILTYIRRNPEWHTVPVIMLTSDSSKHDIQGALAAGADDYLVKPFNPRDLAARLERFLGIAI